MELERNNMRENNFSFLTSIFPENNPLNNGLPSLLDLSSSKASLFQNPYHFDHRDNHHLPLNGSNILNSQTGFGHFTTELGSSSSSSSNPFQLGVSTPCIDPFEPCSNGFTKDIVSTAYNSSVPFPSQSQNQVMHGLIQSGTAKPFWGNQNLTSSAQPVPQTYLYPPATATSNLRDLGSSKNLPDDHNSCISTVDQKGCQKRSSSSAGQKKRKRIHMIRKASKVQKKSNVIKGQWTPQEDR